LRAAKKLSRTLHMLKQFLARDAGEFLAADFPQDHTAVRASQTLEDVF
jgi:hypothetical protein